MSIHIQLIHRGKTLHKGDTVTLRFPLDATRTDRDLAISEEIIPLLDKAESDYYLPDPANLQQIGHTLYRWLDGADRYLARAIEHYQGGSNAVALFIQLGAGLGHLPWELLHDGTSYLVQSRPTAVIPVRWQPGNVPDTSFYNEPQNRPLQVAFMATAPVEAAESPLDYEGEEARIMEATRHHGLALHVEESGNLGELGSLLAGLGEAQTDIVHLTGHADHTDDGPCFLCEDEVGGMHRASAQDIIDSLAHRPRLLFLSGCRTGQAMQGGTVPSLAEKLVEAGVPAVLGWGQPVYDSSATVAATMLYEKLAQGLSLIRALAYTYDEMLKLLAQNPPGSQHSCQHWHLLRLYARGQEGTASSTTIEQGVVTARQTRGRARLTTPRHEPEFLDDDEARRVPVANRANFVGRRRALQRCLRALRADSDHLGIIVYGMGGLGKSTLAHRLRQRMLQNVDQYRAVVLFGELDEGYLLRRFNNAIREQAMLEALNGPGDLYHRLWNALNTSNPDLLLILDNFEDNFERDGAGDLRLINGAPLLSGTAVQLLTDLTSAVYQSNQEGHAHRLIITSRYAPTWADSDRFHHEGLVQLGAEAVAKKVIRLRPDAPKLAAKLPHADETAEQRLYAHILRTAEGNPRLLEWLFALLPQSEAGALKMEPILDQMDEKATQFRENILAAELLAAQTPTLRQMLARGLTCQLPVPNAIFDILDTIDPILPNTQHERALATQLGLLETTSSLHPVIPSSAHLRVPQILQPLLVEEPQPEPTICAAAAAQRLYALWWEAEDVQPTEAQKLELHRLALAGGEGEIAQVVAEALVGRWNRSDQYRYREVIDLVTKTTEQVGGTNDLWLQLGNAQDSLGEKHIAIKYYEQALATCSTDDNAFQAQIYNNLGYVYSSLGDKEEALRYYNMALPLQQQVGDKGGEATTLTNIGAVYDDLGDKEEALRYYNMALPLQQQVGDKGGEATTLTNIGAVYDDLGDKEEALRYYNMALPLQQQVGDKRGEATTLNNMGSVYDDLGDKEEALRYYNMALPLRQQVGDKGGEATTLTNIGAVYSSLGDKEEALRYFNMALPLIQQVGDKGGEATTLSNIGAVYSSLGDKEEALRYYNMALPLRQQVGDRWGEAVTRYNMAMAYRATGRLNEAVELLEQVVAIDEATGHPDLAADQGALDQVRAELVGSRRAG